MWNIERIVRTIPISNLNGVRYSEYVITVNELLHLIAICLNSDVQGIGFYISLNPAALRPDS